MTGTQLLQPPSLYIDARFKQKWKSGMKQSLTLGSLEQVDGRVAIGDQVALEAQSLEQAGLHCGASLGNGFESLNQLLPQTKRHNACICFSCCCYINQ